MTVAIFFKQFSGKRYSKIIELSLLIGLSHLIEYHTLLPIPFFFRPGHIAKLNFSHRKKVRNVFVFNI